MIALIVAAGSGRRMQQHIPKQFLLLKGRPVLYHTIKSFLDFHLEMKIVLVIQAGHEEYLQSILPEFPGRDIQVTYGGETRFQSVLNGLNMIGENEIVFIHDAARPFVSLTLLQRCYDETMKNGHAIPAIRVKDSFRILNKDSLQQINRNLLRAMQTPQTFQSSLIKEAYQQASGSDYTDDASVFEVLHKRIQMVEGDDENIKITTPVDWFLAESILNSRAD